MGLESATYISDLVATNPAAGDNRSEGDDHLRLVKSVLKASFPNLTGAVSPTQTELNYVDGVTSAIQTQIDAKAPTASPTFTGTINGAAMTLTGAVNLSGLLTGSAGLTISGGAVTLTSASSVAAPTPAAASNGTAVATTEWVRTYGATASGTASRAEMFFMGSN